MANSTEEMQTEIKKRRLVSVRIEGLFGNLTHFIPLNADSGITILTGPNGCGKTTILRLIKASEDFAVEYNLRVLLDVPYREIVFCFDDETELAVIKIDDVNELKNGEPATPLNHPCGIGFEGCIYLDIKPPRDKIFNSKCALQFIERRTADNSTINSYTSGIFGPDIMPGRLNSVMLHEGKKLPCWAGGCYIHTQFISTERIEPQRTNRYEMEKGLHMLGELVIEEIGERFIKRVFAAKTIMISMTKKLNRSRKSREIDRAEREADYAAEELNIRLQKIVDKQKRLNDAGIIIGELPFNKLKASATIAALSIYVEDEEQKLGVFDALLREAELFQKIVNSRLGKKRLILNDAEGLKVINSHSGESVPLHLLSSGEQHEINLFFDLIFPTASNSLVLVDEPELSLHIAWQLKFIDDISKVRELRGCQFLLATHSPAIIDDHWDYVVELEA